MQDFLRITHRTGASAFPIQSIGNCCGIFLFQFYFRAGCQEADLPYFRRVVPLYFTLRLFSIHFFIGSGDINRLFFNSPDGFVSDQNTFNAY